MYVGMYAGILNIDTECMGATEKDALSRVLWLSLSLSLCVVYRDAQINKF